MNFEIPTTKSGDNYDRFWVRMLEVRQSISIIEQCYKQIEPGPVRSTPAMLFRPEPGESYVPIEAPKGEFGIFLVSDGANKPYRLKIRAPGFAHLAALNEMSIGHMLSDVVTIIGTQDIVFGEIDR